jgi:hypothetical protein
MNKVTTSKNLALCAVGAALLAACASVGTGVAWNILPAGSTWQVSQRNTGSYGKDTTFLITRGDALWEGKQVVTFTNSESGIRVMALPDGRWVSILGRDGKTLATYDPPIGYVYPLSVGQSWSTTHQMTTAKGTREINYSCTVEGREQVAVPAGNFDTMKIVCESPVSRDVSWTATDMGIHPKQEFQRFANHPQGAGTQQSQLMAVNRRS